MAIGVGKEQLFLARLPFIGNKFGLNSNHLIHYIIVLFIDFIQLEYINPL